MDAGKVINLVLTDLAVDKSKIEYDLEALVNAEWVTDRYCEIKQCLEKLVINELMINKLQSLINNNVKPKENG